MKYQTEKCIIDESGNKFYVGDTVSIKFPNGGGCGSCTISKITDKGFHFAQGKKSVQFENISELYMMHSIHRRSTGKHDISGQEVKENDIIECQTKGKYFGKKLVIKYGTYQACCPREQIYVDSVGFYTAGKDCEDMPIGPLENYVKVIGNTEDNPELIEENL